MIAATLGVGLVFTESLKKVVFEDERWALNAINNGYMITGFLLIGGIYGALS